MNARQYKKKHAKAYWQQPVTVPPVFTIQGAVPRKFRTCVCVPIEDVNILGRELFSSYARNELISNFMASPEFQNCISYDIELSDYHMYKVTAEMTLLCKEE